MKIKIIETGEIVEAVLCDDTTVEVFGDGRHLGPYDFVIVDPNNIAHLLRCMVPGVTLSLNVEPDEAERIWYSEVSYKDRKDFDIFIERAPHGCDVNIILWEDFLTGADIGWKGYSALGSLTVFLLFLLWGAING